MTDRKEIVVIRDREHKDTVLLIDQENIKGKYSYFIIKNQRPIKILGETVTTNKRKQVWAIANKSKLHEYPVDVLESLRKNYQRPRFYGRLRERIRPLSMAGINPLDNGAMAINYTHRRLDANKQILVKNTLKKLVSLPDAIRMQDHILENIGYFHTSTGEKSRLVDYEKNFRVINFLLANWQNSGLANRSFIISKLTQIMIDLENCRNPEKVEIYYKLLNIHDLTDILGRYNPGASAASVLSMLGFLYRRLASLKLIAPAILTRKHLLNIELDIHQYHVGRAGEQLITVIKRCLNEADNFDKVMFERQINIAKGLLQQLMFSPFVPLAQPSLLLLDKAITHRKSGKKTKALRHVLLAHHLLANELPFCLDFCSTPSAARQTIFSL